MGIFKKKKPINKDKKQSQFDKDYSKAWELLKSCPKDTVKIMLPWSNQGWKLASFAIQVAYRTMSNEALLAGRKEESEDYLEKVAYYQQRSADQGIEFDAYITGRNYEFGRNGMAIDYKKAMYYYQLGVQQGEPQCIRSVGEMYYYAKGVPADLAKGLEWYEKAYYAGDPWAMINIADAYTDGKGVKLDRNRARECYELAMQLAKRNMSECPGDKVLVDRANDVVRFCTRSIDELEAIKLSEQYFALGNQQNQLAGNQIIEKLRQMAAQGNERAAFDLGSIFKTRKDYVQAIHYYETVRKRFGNSSYNIGIIYYNGMMGSRDYKTAFSYFLSGAENYNSRYCMYQLSKMYKKGEYIKQSDKKAFIYMEKAARGGYLEAYKELGEMYERGIGVKADLEQAITYYRKAIDVGQTDADAALSRAMHKRFEKM